MLETLQKISMKYCILSVKMVPTSWKITVKAFKVNVYTCIGSNSAIFIFVCQLFKKTFDSVVVVVALLFYVHGKHLRSCRDSQLT